jgi:hypothetical protein
MIMIPHGHAILLLHLSDDYFQQPPADIMVASVSVTTATNSL